MEDGRKQIYKGFLKGLSEEELYIMFDAVVEVINEFKEDKKE